MKQISKQTKNIANRNFVAEGNSTNSATGVNEKHLSSHNHEKPSTLTKKNLVPYLHNKKLHTLHASPDIRATNQQIRPPSCYVRKQIVPLSSRD